MEKRKRAMVLNDISVSSEYSLTVALPVLSAAEVETSIIPTSVLSTHIGGFTDSLYRDLPKAIPEVAQHGQTLNLNLDAIYTRYIASFAQMKIVSQFIDRFSGNDTLIFVDPVMADNSERYQCSNLDFSQGMINLCGKADVIVPNMDEAMQLLDQPYREGPYSHKYIDQILESLGKLGPKQVILTGVYFDDRHLGAAAYNRLTGEIDYILSEWITGSFHGAGDVFASALLSAILKDLPIPKATRIAVDFTVGSILRAKKAGTDIRFGANFGAGIPEFVKRLSC